MLHLSTLSTFIPGSQLETMAVSPFGLDYGNCSLDELNDFVMARKLRAESDHLVDRETCTLMLEHSDRTGTFRFEDLPPELRNDVYARLLLLPEPLVVTFWSIGSWHTKRNFRGCHPQIIATCSKFRKEASSYLYGENEIEILILRSICRLPQTQGDAGSGVFIPRIRLKTKIMNGPYGYLRTSHQDWPSVLLKFHKLRIKIVTDLIFVHKLENRYRDTMAHTLYSLVSVLQRSSSLKTVTIEGNTRRGRQYVSASSFNGVVYPLARLLSGVDCKVQGFTHYPAAEPHLRSLAAQHAEFYKNNVLHYASLVRDESEAYKALTEISHTTSKLREHIKLRGQLFRVFDQAFQQLDDERHLWEWADKMAHFLTKTYDKEVKTTMGRASKFWLSAAKRFEAAHKDRRQHFPDGLQGS